jgi:hypothetical protein
MKLRPALNSFIVEDLKQLVRLCGGPGPDGVRKEQLVEYMAGRLTNPVALAEIWRRLDPLSQKAVATAYYAGASSPRKPSSPSTASCPDRWPDCLCPP